MPSPPQLLSPSFSVRQRMDEWHYVCTDPSDWTMTWSGSLPVENRSRLAEVRDTLEHRSTRFTMRFISP